MVSVLSSDISDDRGGSSVDIDSYSSEEVAHPCWPLLMKPMHTVLTAAVLGLLIGGVFEPVFIFLIGMIIAMVVNYKKLRERK